MQSLVYNNKSSAPHIWMERNFYHRIYALFSFFAARLELEAMLHTPAMMSGRLNIWPISIGNHASKAT